MLFSFSGRTQFCEISHNLFFNNEAQENSVAVLVETGPANLSFRDNYMFGNAADGFANPPGGATMIIDVAPGAIEHNMFVSSEGYAVHHGISSSPPSYVLNCYWGDSTGPLHHIENPLGQGDSVHNRVSVTPWSVDSLFTPSSANESRPTTFALGFPYPNPFNSTVTIEYALIREQDVTLEIYDVLGRQVETLLSERQGIGVHSVKWNADDFATGLYFAKLSTPTGTSQAVKLLLMK
ncbi:MAG: T9SS type A sorting domain-containing protein [bacterium]|nr:T9SS type A sorting domain-containing protein [bacterium]